VVRKNKDLNYYMSLNYPIELVRDEGEIWFAQIPLLPGCMTNGLGVLDALNMLEDAKRCWLESMLEDGLEIPEPEEDTYPKEETALGSLRRALSDLFAGRTFPISTLWDNWDG
jgi:predicted RNase H-like HicB family nuclease